MESSFWNKENSDAVHFLLLMYDRKKKPANDQEELNEFINIVPKHIYNFEMIVYEPLSIIKSGVKETHMIQKFVTPVFIAAKNYNLKLLDYLLNSHIDINFLVKNYPTSQSLVTYFCQLNHDSKGLKTLLHILNFGPNPNTIDNLVLENLKKTHSPLYPILEEYINNYNNSQFIKKIS